MFNATRPPAPLFKEAAAKVADCSTMNCEPAPETLMAPPIVTTFPWLASKIPPEETETLPVVRVPPVYWNCTPPLTTNEPVLIVPPERINEPPASTLVAALTTNPLEASMFRAWPSNCPVPAATLVGPSADS